MMTVYVDMPLIASVNETVFGDFLDCLYFALYEGAGKDKLRFHISNGGPLNDDECQLIWHIKLLRNKWLRHDADHGESKAVQKSNRDLAMTLKSLGLDVFPNRASHFQQLQRKLLEMAEEFLKRLLERIPLG